MGLRSDRASAECPIGSPQELAANTELQQSESWM